MQRPQAQEGREQETAQSGKTLRIFLAEHGLLERVTPMVPDTALDVTLTPGEIAELAQLLKEENQSSLAVMVLSIYTRERIMSSRLRRILTAAEEVAHAVGERKMGLIWDIIAGFRERLGRRNGQTSE